MPMLFFTRKIISPSRLALFALAVNTGLALSFVGLWLVAARQGLFWRADFSAYYTGWKMVIVGTGNQLYDFDLQSRYQQEILQSRSFADGLLPFDYPPHMAWLFAPLAWLPLSVAYGIWSLGQLALLAWFLWLLSRLTTHWEKRERRLMLVSVVAFAPLFYTILLGTFGLMLAVWILQFYIAIKDDRQCASGLWLSLASIKPQSIILLGIFLVAARRWRAILSVAVVGIFFFSVTGLMFGWNIWVDFARVIREVAQLSGEYGIYPKEMYNFRGVLASVLGDDAAEIVSAISLAAFLITILGVLWLWKTSWQKQTDLKFALTICLGLLFNLHLNPQDSLLLVIPAVLFYDTLRQRGLPRQQYAAFALSIPLVFILSEFSIRGSLIIRVPIILLTILTIWIAKTLWDERNYDQS